MTKHVLFLLPVLVLITLCLYFIVTTVPGVHYWVDDFCSATVLRNNGYFGAQISWWKSWTGRYSAVAFTDFFELLGPWVVKIIPILLLLLLVLSAIPLFFSSTIFSSFFIILTLINAPNIIQSFYWQTGSLNYAIPFIFLNFFLSILVSKKEKTSLVVPFIILFVAGGFSESFALAAIPLLVFILIGILIINPKDRRLKLVISGILGTILSLVVMYLAPGNAARSLSVTKPESLMFVVKWTLLTTKWYLFRMLSIKPFLYSLMLLAFSGFFFSKESKVVTKKLLMVMAISIMAIIATTAAVIGSGYYSMSIIPPERTLFIAIYMFLLCFFVFSVCASVIIKRSLSKSAMGWVWWGIIIANLIVTSILVKSTFSHWSDVKSEVVTYAAEWDKEEKNLPVIKNIKPVGELDSFTDNKGWVTSCIAGYYGFKSVVIQTYDDKNTDI